MIDSISWSEDPRLQLWSQNKNNVKISLISFTDTIFHTSQFMHTNTQTHTCCEVTRYAKSHYERESISSVGGDIRSRSSLFLDRGRSKKALRQNYYIIRMARIVPKGAGFRRTKDKTIERQRVYTERSRPINQTNAVRMNVTHTIAIPSQNCDAIVVSTSNSPASQLCPVALAS